MHSSEKLNKVGLKATGPRLRVLQVFQGTAHLHLTAEDVHHRLLAEHSDAGLATVYRVLNQLTDVGILSRSVFESGTALYELQREGHHDHLICLGCGRVDEFADDVIEERQRAIAEQAGYALAQHQLALYGYCPACRGPKERA